MPARLRDIIRALDGLGIRVRNPKRGSHFLAYDDAGRNYPLSAHNGEKTEISDKYIKGLCRTFEIELDEFKKRL